MLEVHHSKITCVEKGRRRLDVVEFVKWRVALQVNPRDIIGQIWLFEMDEQTASFTPSWSTDKDAAETKKFVYKTRANRGLTPAGRGT